jgi:hypothetical protein
MPVIEALKNSAKKFHEKNRGSLWKNVSAWL